MKFVSTTSSGDYAKRDMNAISMCNYTRSTIRERWWEKLQTELRRISRWRNSTKIMTKPLVHSILIQWSINWILHARQYTPNFWEYAGSFAMAQWIGIVLWMYSHFLANWPHTAHTKVGRRFSTASFTKLRLARLNHQHRAMAIHFRRYWDRRLDYRAQGMGRILSLL